MIRGFEKKKREWLSVTFLRGGVFLREPAHPRFVHVVFIGLILIYDAVMIYFVLRPREIYYAIVPNSIFRP